MMGVRICNIIAVIISITAIQQCNTTGWFRTEWPRYMRSRSDLYAANSEEQCQELWFDQTLDHFDSLNLATGKSILWKQRYFQRLNEDAITKKTVKPIFVYIGGEGTLHKGTLSTGLIAEMGAEFEAHIYGLEHRFYGVSHPKTTSAVEDLRYLSMPQAIEDLARFIAFAKNDIIQQSGLPEDQHIPIVVFGCSYPGVLSAYLRVKYPALITGAIASSAPVIAKEQFIEYDQCVKSTLPESCRSSITKALRYIEEKIFKDDTEAEKLFKKFDCDGVPFKEEDDKIGLLYILVDMISSSVQYNVTSSFNVHKVCEAMQNKENEEAIDALATLVQEYFAYEESNCYNESVAGLRDTKLDDSNRSAARLWLWQSCTAFGYWQVGYPESLRTQLIDVDYHLRLCSKLFPIAGEYSANVANVTNLWGGANHIADHSAATNIHFTNGEHDPWASLSVRHIDPPFQKERGIDAYIIKDGSHCMDFHGAQMCNTPSAKLALETIKHRIQNWVYDKQYQSVNK